MPRGNTTDRGYDYAHQRERRRWVAMVAAGEVACWRCGHLIAAGDPWDLGHDDDDRSIWRGPEHARCNRSSAATRGNRMRGRRRHRPPNSLRQSWEL